MMNLLYYALYLDARDGTALSELCRTYGLRPSEVQERVDAATLCFERQVQRIQFLTLPRLADEIGAAEVAR